MSPVRHRCRLGPHGHPEAEVTVMVVGAAPVCRAMITLSRCLRIVKPPRRACRVPLALAAGSRRNTQ